MSANHKIHYHEKDGDIFLKAENTIFLIHKTFLSLSSEFFKDLFKLAKPSSNENVNIIDGTTIEMNGETSESIERMLSFIYPNTFVEITWDNVEDLKMFYYHLPLADKYSFPKVFKESSKLLLDDFQKYRSDPTYDELSQRAKLKLTDAWYHYTNSLHIYFGKNSHNNEAMTVAMPENHKIHYYENGGDIFLKAEDKIFLLHKSILSLASEFFEDLFKLSKPSSNENVNIIEGTHQSSNTFATIEMNGETSESIERIKLTKSCSVFLLQHCQEEVLLSFTLAERYNLGTLFKESSKLLLDDLQKYRSEPIYDELSERTKLKLMDTWFHYTNSLHKYFVSKRSTNNSFGEFLNSESPKFFLKPSKFSKFFKDCESKFYSWHSIKIEELLKNYEKLKFQPIQLNEANESSKNQYIFIELEN
ncbi:3107_t:CDS:2 [Funneliformis caledonium]|uniref:3107_t:CDS:1 n=1 Tax=Funneliformis caledonium TaxID=1117310 RepID=A0A9N9EQY6_9GLOM|nr:3107_t:CDS:2 [Funneliformis caledonium]